MTPLKKGPVGASTQEYLFQRHAQVRCGAWDTAPNPKDRLRPIKWNADIPFYLRQRSDSPILTLLEAL